MTRSTPPGLPGDIAALLGPAVQPLQVDVVDLERVDSDLAHRILRDGVLLVEHDAKRRVAVETRQRADYFDMQHLRETYRRSGQQ